MKFFLYIPGAGRLWLPGKKSHDMSLGCSQLHFFQGGCHSLIGTPVENPDQMTIVDLQQNHLQKRSTLQNNSSTEIFFMQ